MSLPRVEYQVDKSTDPTKVTLTFKGTCNCDLGHGSGSDDCGHGAGFYRRIPPRARCRASKASAAIRFEERMNVFRAIDPSVTMVAKKFRIMRDRKREEEKEEKEGKKKMDELKKRRREEFLEKGVYAKLYGLLERKVECASMCTDHLLDLRRKKLRELLLAEEESYAKEYVALCQAASKAKEEELQRKAVEIKAKQEEERREMAERKMTELKIQDCEPARPYLAKKALLMVKEDQLWQIKERYALQEAKREEERMYHDLMMKNLLEMKERDEENAKLQWLKRKETKEMFAEQMRWKHMKDEKEKQMKEFEKRQMEEAVRSYKEDGEKEIEERRRRTAERIVEYQQYLKREREIKERRQKEEEEIDKAFNRLMEIEEETERRRSENGKERLKREMDNYLENCREIQRLKDAEERKCNDLIEELSRKIRAQQDSNRARLKAAKQELLNNVMKERAEQVREKRERERREEEARNREIELLNLQIEQQRKIREEYERERTEKRLQYGQQLKLQMKEYEEAKDRKRQEDQEYARHVRREEERKVQETEDILNKSCGIPMHPMKHYILTHPPSYDRGLPCPR